MKKLFDVQKRPRPAVEAAEIRWIKSSYSGYTGNCVEVARLADDRVGVRDSMNPTGGVLGFTSTQWGAFVGGIRDGER